MADEYPIDPSRFAAALREQRLKQIAYDANRIEGSRLDEDQTLYIYETPSAGTPSRSMTWWRLRTASSCST